MKRIPFLVLGALMYSALLGPATRAQNVNDVDCNSDGNSNARVITFRVGTTEADRARFNDRSRDHSKVFEGAKNWVLHYCLRQSNGQLRVQHIREVKITFTDLQNTIQLAQGILVMATNSWSITAYVAAAPPVTTPTPATPTAPVSPPQGKVVQAPNPPPSRVTGAAPTEQDGRVALEGIIRRHFPKAPSFTVTSFAKTNGIDRGQNYQMMYRATIEFPNGVAPSSGNFLVDFEAGADIQSSLMMIAQKGFRVIEGNNTRQRTVMEANSAIMFIKSERGWLYDVD